MCLFYFNKDQREGSSAYRACFEVLYAMLVSLDRSLPPNDEVTAEMLWESYVTPAPPLEMRLSTKTQERQESMFGDTRTRHTERLILPRTGSQA